MNKAELIRKIAKRSGIPETDTKIFFEMFLRRASSILKKGDALKFNGLGYFQLQQGVTKENVYKSDQRIIYSNLMVYYPFGNQIDETEEKIIFNVPVTEENEFEEIDSHFSLSIGKPVIPIAGVNETELFFPSRGNEMRKLIESKVDKLLLNAEVIDRYTKGNEILVIGSENIGIGQLELDLKEEENSFHTTSESSKNLNEEKSEKTSEFGHVAWDFGYDLEKQIEEEAIIDSANDIPEEIPGDIFDVEKISWDFDNPVLEEESANEENLTQETESLPTPQVEREDTAEGQLTSEDEEKIETADENIDNFERVKPVTSDFSDKEILKLNKRENLSWDFGANLSNEDEEIPLTESGSNSNETAEHELVNESVVHEEDDKNTIEVESSKNELKETTVPEVKHEEKISEENKTSDVSDKTPDNLYSNEKTSLPFWVALVTIVAVGVALFLYLKSTSFKFPWGNNNTKVKTKEINVSHPKIIKRNYEVPVTYPYGNGRNTNGKNSISNGVKKKSTGENVSKRNKTDKAASVFFSKTKLKNKKSLKIYDAKPRLSERAIKQNIIKSGENYLVHVSSWQSTFVANKEAEKYNKRGFKSTVEKISIPGRGIWYRVIVGNFKSLEKAENFLRNNE